MPTILFCSFLLLTLGAIVLRLRLSKESPLRSILYSYGLMFFGALCPASIILLERPKDFFFFLIILILVGLLLSGVELFFAWAVRPTVGKRYREELDEIFGRKQ